MLLINTLSKGFSQYGFIKKCKKVKKLLESIKIFNVGIKKPANAFASAG